MERKKAYFINGGAGRTVASIPAFEKLYEKDQDFIIVCEGGMDFYKGHPQLHELAYDNWHKNLFKDYLKTNECINWLRLDNNNNIYRISKKFKREFHN